MAMAEPLSARQAETAFNEAMNAAQTEMRAIAKDASSDKASTPPVSWPWIKRPARSTRRRASSLSFDTWRAALLPTISGRSATSPTGRARPGPTASTCQRDGKGAKGGDVMTKTHATGAAMTYGQRYLFPLIFNLAIGEDNDGRGTMREGIQRGVGLHRRDQRREDWLLDLARPGRRRPEKAAAEYPRTSSALSTTAPGTSRPRRPRAPDFPGRPADDHSPTSSRTPRNGRDCGLGILDRQHVRHGPRQREGRRFQPLPARPTSTKLAGEILTDEPAGELHQRLHGTRPRDGRRRRGARPLLSLRLHDAEPKLVGFITNHMAPGASPELAGG